MLDIKHKYDTGYSHCFIHEYMQVVSLGIKSQYWTC